ncbi:shikimate kinase [Campylobacter sp. 19-13652]|uniref:shikimate kinase n=1 Tax=Campylobacter sp. 19-13652 TaxID=2840180 RepID=UPI001C8661B0|nr:shikimate kinase [Campylobacter sp. 19-13652]
MKSNIILIGFMGCGKSSVARALAKKLERICLDTDALIEQSQNRKIKKIFSAQGEAAFRKMEKELLKRLKASVQNAVIATGGGFGVQKGLKKLGLVVYLKMEFDEILSRLSGDKKQLKSRPLLKDLNAAKALFNARAGLYEKRANLIIEVKNKSVKEIAKEIRSKI